MQFRLILRSPMRGVHRGVGKRNNVHIFSSKKALSYRMRSGVLCLSLRSAGAGFTLTCAVMVLAGTVVVMMVVPGRYHECDQTSDGFLPEKSHGCCLAH